MEIIKIHYKISKPVVSYKEIKADVEAIKRFMLDPRNFKGLYNKPFAIAHAQVSETPMAFFVVAPECLTEKMFDEQVVINPEIVEAPTHKNIQATPDDMKKRGLDPEKIKGQIKMTIPNAIEYQEMCMSFPFRNPKRLIRYDTIRVRYQKPGLFGFKTVERELSGIASQIYQHEYDHTQGKNIYFESETPVKWWELIGNEKSKGGTSLDPADSLGLTAQKEKARDANMAQ